ncbi:MAG: YihY/virulence factor BrkB family protein [Planctomycetia bacterium]|nr:YihY/virulence factor BrkB family protein [Planctomycetia bacterium]
MNGKLHSAWSMLKEAVVDFVDHNSTRLGASFAFYSILSLAPLLVFTIAIGETFLDADEVRKYLVDEVRRAVGNEGAKAVETMLAKRRPAEGSLLATLLGLGTLLFGASGAFGEVQAALNTIWGVQPKPNAALWTMLRYRFLSFCLVLGTGFLMLTSMVIGTIVTAAGTFVNDSWPNIQPLEHWLTMLAAFVLATLLFAMIFKILPDAKVPWRDVWSGALLTASLFTIGKFLIGLYIVKSGLSSAYGAAGSLVVLVVWIYYSAQILFFGAELTHVYSKRRGAEVPPTEVAYKKKPAKARR